MTFGIQLSIEQFEESTIQLTKSEKKELIKLYRKYLKVFDATHHKRGITNENKTRGRNNHA